jgi:hypothetical protein
MPTAAIPLLSEPVCWGGVGAATAGLLSNSSEALQHPSLSASTGRKRLSSLRGGQAAAAER